MLKQLMLSTMALLTIAFVGDATAASLESLQGAWTMDSTTCESTFKTVDGHVRFQDRGASTNTGIIISGNKITGSNGVCTADRVRRNKDRLTVSMSCSDAVLFSEVSVSFRMIDDQRFERIDPEFSDVLATYHRCSR